MNVLAPLLFLFFFACSSTTETPAPADTTADSDTSAPADATVDGGDSAVAPDLVVADTSQEDSSSQDATSDVPDLPEVDYCTQIGMTKADFQTEGAGPVFGDIAADFTVNLLDGSTWTLSEAWTGCDSYLFFTYFQFQSSGAQSYMNQVWNSNLRDVLAASQENVHIFFISAEFDQSARNSRMDGVQGRIDVALNQLYPNDEEARLRWKERLHLVTDRLPDIQGGVGAFANDYLYYLQTAAPVDLGDRGDAYAPYPLNFAIGRDQRWDPAGTLSEYVGGPDNLKMTAYNTAFYNHRAELRARLDSEEATAVFPLINEVVTARIFVKEVTLPDANEMANFDTMELDVAVTCQEQNPFACSEWDRIARISLCTEFDPVEPESCTAKVEIVRWITPYWRRGRRHWVMDASPFLSLVQAGATQRFRIEMGPSWERATPRLATMSVRLSNQDKGIKSRAALYAFGGGNFNADYNEGREPFQFTPPESATRVEIVSIISGHGQTAGNNCAEWCNHVHNFTVNNAGSAHTVSYMGIFSPFGCADRADEGVVPGQWGNWSQLRAGWCPGLPVETVRFDITSEVTLGAENTLTYEATFQQGAPQGGDISMSTYIVWYED